MRRFESLIKALLLTSCLISGCGTMSSNRGWGQDATYAPGWERLAQAALNAARAPATWAPAVGALVLQTGHADRNISEWASQRTPVFGSPRRADRMSDDLLAASGIIWGASVVATPSGDTLGEWTINKTKGGAVEGGAAFLMKETVDYVKNAVHRERPDRSDRLSFPSGHASGSAVFTTMASKNLDAINENENMLTISRIGLGAVTAATAWARVEANQHFPSDVLAGTAIGHFFGVFFTDAFLGIDNPRNVLVLFEPSREGAFARVQFNF